MVNISGTATVANALTAAKASPGSDPLAAAVGTTMADGVIIKVVVPPPSLFDRDRFHHEKCDIHILAYIAILPVLKIGMTNLLVI